MKTVVIVSRPEDAHASLVKRRLLTMGRRVLLLNLGEYPVKGEIALQLSGEKREEPCITMRQGRSVLTGDEVESVWWRRPNGPVRDISRDLLGTYVRSESESLIYSMESFLESAKWVSLPSATRQANRKPVQLQAAIRLGFKIPHSCIGNSWGIAKTFLDEMGSLPVIMKPVGSAFARLNHKALDKSGKNRVIYTRILDKELFIANKESVQNCPFILQEAIDKDFDVRVTVVGTKVFAVSIRTSTGRDDPNFLDWRRLNALRVYEAHSLPSAIAHRCVQLTQELGLKFGCLDLGYSRRRGYIFFEINPQGQWTPSELLAGHPISLTLAKFLVEKPRRRATRAPKSGKGHRS